MSMVRYQGADVHLKHQACGLIQCRITRHCDQEIRHDVVRSDRQDTSD
jgi:hypothetical protein